MTRASFISSELFFFTLEKPLMWAIVQLSEWPQWQKPSYKKKNTTKLLRCFQLEEFKFFYRKPFTKRIYGDLRDWITHKASLKKGNKNVHLVWQNYCKTSWKGMLGALPTYQATIQVLAGCKKLLQKEESRSASCNNISHPATTWFVARQVDSLVVKPATSLFNSKFCKTSCTFPLPVLP